MRHGGKARLDVLLWRFLRRKTVPSRKIPVFGFFREPARLHVDSLAGEGQLHRQRHVKLREPERLQSRCRRAKSANKPGALSSSAKLPVCTIFPLARTMMRSALRTAYCRRCAMTSRA